MIRKNEPRVTLTHKLHYDHLKCNKERARHIRERYGIEQDYTHGQQTLI